jgi:hypothetical protein
MPAWYSALPGQTQQEIQAWYGGLSPDQQTLAQQASGQANDFASAQWAFSQAGLPPIYGVPAQPVAPTNPMHTAASWAANSPFGGAFAGQPIPPQMTLLTALINALQGAWPQP